MVRAPVTRLGGEQPPLQEGAAGDDDYATDDLSTCHGGVSDTGTPLNQRRLRDAHGASPLGMSVAGASTHTGLTPMLDQSPVPPDHGYTIGPRYSDDRISLGRSAILQLEDASSMTDTAPSLSRSGKSSGNSRAVALRLAGLDAGDDPNSSMSSTAV